MAILKKQIYARPQDADHSEADVWQLAVDTERNMPFILHEWTEAGREAGGKAGSKSIEIGAFLNSGRSGPAESELLRLIATLIVGTADA